MTARALQLEGGGDVADEPKAYARAAILTQEQLAEWLQVSVSVAKGLGLPKLRLPGSRLVRYSAGQVLDYLEGRPQHQEPV